MVPNVDCLELQAIGYLGVWLHNRCWLTASALNANLLNWAGGPCTNSAPLGADEETVGAHRAPLRRVGYPHPGFYQTWTLDNQPRGFNLEKAMPNDLHIWSKT